MPQEELGENSPERIPLPTFTQEVYDMLSTGRWKHPPCRFSTSEK